MVQGPVHALVQGTRRLALAKPQGGADDASKGLLINYDLAGQRLAMAIHATTRAHQLLSAGRQHDVGSFQRHVRWVRPTQTGFARRVDEDHAQR